MLSIEQLERRDAPASITLNAGVLEIVGSGGSDYISVNYVSDTDEIRVSFKTLVAGVYVEAVPTQFFDAADVSQIAADMTDNSGTTFNNMLTNLPGIQTLYQGGAGRDVYQGSSNVVALLGAGNDYVNVFGNAAATIFGGAGNDNIKTGGGNDYIDGGSGTDKLRGGAGVNTILNGEL